MRREIEKKREPRCVTGLRATRPGARALAAAGRGSPQHAMEPPEPPASPPSSPPCSSTNDRILYALRTSLRELDWALVQSTRTWRTPLACTIILVVYLACALLAHRGDMRTLYTRAPPRWWLASPVRFPLVKELVLYTRIYTSVLRVWYVAPGYTVSVSYTHLTLPTTPYV